MSEKNPSELIVITKARELCSYVMTVTQKSPKHFRFTFVTRMQNLSLDVIENHYPQLKGKSKKHKKEIKSRTKYHLTK